MTSTINGFIYMWHDKSRKMFYVGSHIGTEDDGYLCSSRWLQGEIKYRPHDFKRRILKYLPESLLTLEEYRLIKMIKDKEYGTKYYNVKSGSKKGGEPWNKGKTGIYSNTTRQLMSNARKNRPSPTKGKIMAHSAENGKKGAKALSEKASGRKRLYKDDGTWTWTYPK